MFACQSEIIACRGFADTSSYIDSYKPWISRTSAEALIEYRHGSSTYTSEKYCKHHTEKKTARQRRQSLHRLQQRTRLICWNSLFWRGCKPNTNRQFFFRLSSLFKCEVCKITGSMRNKRKKYITAANSILNFPYKTGNSTIFRRIEVSLRLFKCNYISRAECVRASVSFIRTRPMSTWRTVHMSPTV